jgi:GDPmannose 4,6-dehydratase
MTTDERQSATSAHLSDREKRQIDWQKSCSLSLWNRPQQFHLRKRERIYAIHRTVVRILHGMQDKLHLDNPDGERDWGYAPEFVEGIWKMLQQDQPEDFLLATGETHSLREFVERAFGQVGLDWRRHAEVDPQYYRPTEIDRLEGDSSKARRKLGWAPQTTLRDLVKITVETDVQLLEDKPSGQIERRMAMRGGE